LTTIFVGGKAKELVKVCTGERERGRYKKGVGLVRGGVGIDLGPDLRTRSLQSLYLEWGSLMKQPEL
jgi:hypothetical protein